MENFLRNSRKTLAGKIIFIMSLTAITLLAMTFVSGANTVSGDFEYWTLGKEAYIVRYTGKDKNVTVPARIDGLSVVAVEANAFEGNEYIENAVIEAPVTRIQTELFSQCVNLKTVTMPETVTGIYSRAFYNCENLTTVNFSSKIKTIKSGAFYGCASLHEIVLPEKLTTLEENAFRNCTGLSSVSFPSAFKTLKNLVFEGCDALKEFRVPSIETWLNMSGKNFTSREIEYSLYVDGRILTDPVIPDTYTALQAEEFAFCSSITSVTIPPGVETVGKNAFVNCSNLKYVTLPDGLETIGDYAFAYNNGIENIIIPGTVAHIGDMAFFSCTNLKEIHIEYGVTELYSYTFCNCKNLSSVYLPATIEKIGNAVFYNTADTYTVYFYGSEELFGEIEFGKLNTALINAEKYYRTIPDFGILEPKTGVTYITGICGSADTFEISDGEYIGTGDVLRVMNGGAVMNRQVLKVYGDLTGDGLITSTDFAVLHTEINSEEGILSDIQMEVADVDGDGRIRSLDYLTLKNYFNSP